MQKNTNRNAAGADFGRAALVCGLVFALTVSRAVQAQEAPPPRMGAWVAVASEYRVHGLARSLGEPIVKGQVGVSFGRGWALSVGASTMNLNPGPGPSRELSLYGGKAWELDSDWTVTASLGRYEFARGTALMSYDYTEANLEAAWREMLRLRVQYSPDYSIFSRRGPAREFETWTGELQLDYPFARGLAATAAVGYYDLSAGVGAGYYYYSAGGVLTRGRASFALTWVGVDSTARALFNPTFTRDGLIATVAWRVK